MEFYKTTFNEDGTVTITQGYFEQLQDYSNFLEALRQCGVDNWCGYADAIDIAYPDED